MALKGNWIDKINGVDENSAEDINQVAHAVIDLEDSVSKVTAVDDTLTVAGAAADAKAAGDRFAALNEQIAKNADDAGNALSIARNARDVADDARTVAGNANMTALNAKASADSAMARGEEAIRLAASAENLAKNVENQFQGAMTGKRYLEPTDRLDDIKDAGIYVWLSGEAPEGTPTNRSGVRTTIMNRES